MQKLTTQYHFLWLAIALAALFNGACNNAAQPEKPPIDVFLQNMNITLIGTPDYDTTAFVSAFELRYKQPLYHNENSVDSFEQKIYLLHKGHDKPVVLITEGYAANRAYTSELSNYLDANQIIVEHRFFGQSVPDSLDWQALTIKASADDLHRIVMAFKQYYAASWLSTGISKGGQTSIYYRYFYPNDLKASVPYVAPLVFSATDKRWWDFEARVGSAACRESLRALQIDWLKRGTEILPYFIQYADSAGYDFLMDYEEAYIASILEYPYAFWQWGTQDCAAIPAPGAHPRTLIAHVDKADGMSFFTKPSAELFAPFFYQAMREIGFYTYDRTPFAEWIKPDEMPDFKDFMPKGTDTTYYGGSLMRGIQLFINEDARNMAFIYGEYDAWTAYAVDLSNSRSNLLKIVQPKAAHRVRIADLDANLKNQLLDSLNIWLK